MRAAPYQPDLAQLIVCVNRRRPDDPLGGGCAERGEAVYAALRDHLEQERLRARIWLARSYCLGACPRVGGCVAVTPSGELWSEVVPADAAELVALAKRAAHATEK